MSGHGNDRRFTPSCLAQLTGAALDAVRYRGGHVQIIASAGSGKTEVVAQRVADLLADGSAPESIVAFTFTERAADELKNRIVHRVEDRLGRAVLDRLNGLFVAGPAARQQRPVGPFGRSRSGMSEGRTAS